MLDVAKGMLDLDVSAEELAAPREVDPAPRPARRGVLATNVELVKSANVGAVCG